MKLLVELPDTAALRNVDQHYAKAALVATLYHVGKLSEREACATLDMSRRAFEDMLSQFGFSILADDQETLDVELHA